MQRFWGYFFISVLLIAVTFVLVSLVMASVHDVTLLAEWQSWFSVDTITEVEDTATAVVKMVA